MRIDLSAPRPARRRRPWIALLNAVLDLAGGRAELLRHEERPWASITFAGARHTVVLTYRGLDAVTEGESFIAALPEHEFTIPGQLVAEAAIVSVEHALLPAPALTVEIELLLLEEA